MKAIFSLFLILPSLAQASLCTQEADPVLKQFKAQKTWSMAEVSESDVSLSLSGFVDSSQRFYPDGFSKRVSQKAKLEVDPSNQDAKLFKSFCAKYEERGPLLTSARLAQAMNNYELRVRLLPSASHFSNAPYAKLKTHKVNAQLEIDADSLIGRQPRVNELQKEIQALFDQQLANQSRPDRMAISLTNWDDLACDLLHGKVRVSINLEMYSDDTFILRQEKIPAADVSGIYRAWRDQLGQTPSRDELMFTGGAIYATLKEHHKIGNVQAETAFKMIKAVTDLNNAKLKALSQQEMSCLYDSLQTYEAEYTQYQLGAELTFDKNETLQGQE